MQEQLLLTSVVHWVNCKQLTLLRTDGVLLSESASSNDREAEMQNQQM